MSRQPGKHGQLKKKRERKKNSKTTWLENSIEYANHEFKTSPICSIHDHRRKLWMDAKGGPKILSLIKGSTNDQLHHSHQAHRELICMNLVIFVFECVMFERQ